MIGRDDILTYAISLVKSWVRNRAIFCSLHGSEPDIVIVIGIMMCLTQDGVAHVSGRTGPIHSLNIVQALEMCFESALGTVRSVFQNLRLGSNVHVANKKLRDFAPTT
jgi:hypothetical protein